MNQLGLGHSSSVCGPQAFSNVPAAPLVWTNPETTMGHLQAWFSVFPLQELIHGGSAHPQKPVLRKWREQEGRIWDN